ncbi:Rv3212 family protein [Mycolicibacterium mengxianglii]|uniref:Rv3212 family protein n=1 Tax=Mycolicibacterium mengxianglii TaxID=2736649 RepID=UPI0018EEE957|nr:PQQ-binding-like beta-propeller repeat protein [Mycolicibacterium mengxianglii]
MVRPERRTRNDVIAAVVIAAVVALVAGIIWWTSDARTTISRPASDVSTAPASAPAVPSSVHQLWSAPSPHTVVPVVAAGTVVTGDGSTMSGLDPVTGRTRWTYTRDRELCGVTWVYSYAVAVYPDGRGCGQVSTIDAATGKRGPARSGAGSPHIDLSSDGTTVLSVGEARLELWRSDMVRVISFGEVDARVKPVHVGTGNGCALLSAAAGDDTISVLRSCPGEEDVKLSTVRAADEEDEPEVRDIPEPGLRTDSGAQVLAVSDETTAVYVPVPEPHVSVIDETGNEVGNYPMPKSPSSAFPDGSVTKPGDLITWWTGDSVMVFAANAVEYRYTIDRSDTVVPLGPGAMMAQKLLIPVTGGIGVYNPETGARERIIPVDRPAADTAIVPAVVGSTILEQRGHTLVALGG